MFRYFFSIRWPDHVDGDQFGTFLPDDAAALAHAIRVIWGLKQGGGHGSPNDDDRQKRKAQNRVVIAIPSRLRLMPKCAQRWPRSRSKSASTAAANR